MEFSLREWLILIGVVIIVAILIDGFRRYKKGQEYTAQDNDLADTDDLEGDALVRPEGRKPPKEEGFSAQNPIISAFENARKTSKAPLTDVPHKVDSGPEMDRDADLHLDELASLVPERDFGDSAVSEQNYSDDGFYEQDELDLDAPVTENHHEDGPRYEDYERSYSEIDMDQVASNTAAEDLETVEEDKHIAEIEEVIVINIFAPEGQSFSGMELLQLILNCGMRYGEMDIFHRHEDGFDRGRVQFSMANAIEPGTFDLDTMGENDCPGVSFFMGLPGPKNSMKAFDFMLETAQTLVRNLGGELRDERRSPMSEQTIAHCRQRIRDFERRRLMRSKQ
ncbi:cell division protein ZipA [Marinomonas sp. M1K-6]|uniref:Cell division protein ZipA n=1 Tax=Marinomonas profundi TaxID=2726122 RepID=A0A847R6M3_9GAMM|nr:cell division protein ZipA [Marinomonas profundi]NLQ16574.1 cell division protein ZipA [Marinomonas profundi]UDV03840.1 cell division protein ZipA [Marinomonas profundi]